MAPASLLSVLIAASAPSWSIVVTRTIGLDAESGLQTAESLGYVMDGMQSPGLGKLVRPRPFSVDLSTRGGDASVCAASVECAAKLGEVGGVRWLVSLSLARVGSKLVVDATLIDVAAKSAVVQLTQSMAYADPQLGLGTLARQLVDRVPAPRPPEPRPEVSSAPAAVSVTPPPAAPASSPTGVLVPIVSGAAAVVAAGLGTYFALQASGAARQISLLSATPGHTFDVEAQQVDRWGRQAQTFSIASFAAAAGLLVVAVVVFVLR